MTKNRNELNLRSSVELTLTSTFPVEIFAAAAALSGATAETFGGFPGSDETLRPVKANRRQLDRRIFQWRIYSSLAHYLIQY